MNLVRARDMMSLPVVSIASGEDVAEVRDVVYDGEAHRLVGFTLNKRGMFAGRLKGVLAAGSGTAIGPDGRLSWRATNDYGHLHERCGAARGHTRHGRIDRRGERQRSRVS